MEEMSQNPDEDTKEYIFNQTMLRIKDPEKSLNFYTDIPYMITVDLLEKDYMAYKFLLEKYSEYKTTEEYQETIANAGKSEYKNKLQDIEMSDAPKVNAEYFHSTKANMSLLKELLKNRKAEPHKIDGGKAADDIKGITTKEDEKADSPLTKSTNPHPDPKRKK